MAEAEKGAFFRRLFLARIYPPLAGKSLLYLVSRRDLIFRQIMVTREKSVYIAVFSFFSIDYLQQAAMNPSVYAAGEEYLESDKSQFFS
jgi:hypothetical protein